MRGFHFIAVIPRASRHSYFNRDLISARRSLRRDKRRVCERERERSRELCRYMIYSLRRPRLFSIPRETSLCRSARNSQVRDKQPRLDDVQLVRRSRRAYRDSLPRKSREMHPPAAFSSGNTRFVCQTRCLQKRIRAKTAQTCASRLSRLRFHHCTAIDYATGLFVTNTSF